MSQQQMPLATHALSELALDALTEIGRSLKGVDADPAPVRQLGDTLLETAAPPGGGQQFNLVPPDYFQPLERLFREKQAVAPETVEEIVRFVKDVASKLSAFQPKTEDRGATEKLRAFCVGLHQFLIDELRREDAGVFGDWSTDGGGAQASLRAA